MLGGVGVRCRSAAGQPRPAGHGTGCPDGARVAARTIEDFGGSRRRVLVRVRLLVRRQIGARGDHQPLRVDQPAAPAGIALGHADAVLAASIFHYGEFTVRQAKQFLAAQGIVMRGDA